MGLSEIDRRIEHLERIEVELRSKLAVEEEMHGHTREALDDARAEARRLNSSLSFYFQVQSNSRSPATLSQSGYEGEGVPIWDLVIADLEVSPRNPELGPGQAVLDRVIADCRERHAAGTAKYGRPLRARDGGDTLIDAYQEALDLLVYARKGIEEGEVWAPSAYPLARLSVLGLRAQLDVREALRAGRR